MILNDRAVFDPNLGFLTQDSVHPYPAALVVCGRVVRPDPGAQDAGSGLYLRVGVFLQLNEHSAAARTRGVVLDHTGIDSRVRSDVPVQAAAAKRGGISVDPTVPHDGVRVMQARNAPAVPTASRLVQVPDRPDRAILEHRLKECPAVVAHEGDGAPVVRRVPLEDASPNRRLGLVEQAWGPKGGRDGCGAGGVYRAGGGIAALRGG